MLGDFFLCFILVSQKTVFWKWINLWLAPLLFFFFFSPRFEEGMPYIKLLRVGEFHQYLYSLSNHGALDHFLPVTCQLRTATTSLFSKLGKRKLLSLHLVVTNIYITRQQFSDWLHLITVILQTDIRDKGHKSMLSGSLWTLYIQMSITGKESEHYYTQLITIRMPLDQVHASVFYFADKWTCL